MSGKNSKKLRRVVRQHMQSKEDEMMLKAFAEIRSWPFWQRVKFAWRLVFPKRKKVIE